MHLHITQIELNTHREIQVANLEDKKMYRAIYCNSASPCSTITLHVTSSLTIYLFMYSSNTLPASKVACMDAF